MKVWQAVIVVEFPCEPGDFEVKHGGDALIDFAQRSVNARLRPALEQMRAAIPGSRWLIRPSSLNGELHAAEVRYA